MSGLAEITYDTGAQVLLQGPVTYQVDSSRSGFLSVGKLAARIEKKAASGRKSNPISYPPLFAVRTPTAVVTDLGTEFGVEVRENGETSSHVFRGSVQLQRTGVAEGKESPNNTIILHANEAACVKVQNGGKQNNGETSSIATGAKENELAILRTEFNTTAFVLPDQLHQYAEEQKLKPFQRWQAYSQQLRKDPALVAYYTFELSPDASTSILPNLSAAGHALDGHVVSGDWVDGRFPNKLAVYFHGSNSGDRIVLPSTDRFEFAGAFSLAIWFNASSMRGGGASLITKGENSWRFQHTVAEGWLSFDTNDANATFGTRKYYQQTTGHTNAVDNRWHLAIAVYKPHGNMAKQQVYVDGHLDAESTVNTIPQEQSTSPIWLGANSELEGRELSGRIDEVAIFSRALSAEEVAAMFRAGNPEND
jgi:hypothetical protein